MLVNKKYWSSADTQELTDSLKNQELSKLTDKRITVLPRGPVVAAQETEPVH